MWSQGRLQFTAPGYGTGELALGELALGELALGVVSVVQEARWLWVSWRWVWSV
jgi:hypothetical protein